MKRNIAFFISNNNDVSTLNKAVVHFQSLAKRFGYKIYSHRYRELNIYIVYEEEVIIDIKNDSVSFIIGNLGDSILENDRFLKVCIREQNIKIENDYAGTIPVYYSLRKYLSLSNIEPCVMIDSNSTTDDISYENIYGYLRYMHFIWDETAYRHIFTMLPDSEYLFDYIDLKVSEKYLETVKASDNNKNISNQEVAKRLNDLNDELVYDSLEKYSQIILPLSSGYDSRMILASLSKRKELKDKLYCFTYGSIGSVEVEAGRRLTKELGVKWYFIDLPLRFLTKEYLFDIHDVFGSSLHMHGMYQLEFFNEISKKIDIKENSCLTSGFMTGVPAGQHNSLLGISESTSSLTNCMNKFSQSKYWSDEELNNMDVFKNNNYIQKAEEKFQKAFNRFNGEIYQKAVMFDVWSRQRNFIGYYPRTLEWKIPTVSPHMNKKYANFFMSISKEHLDDRLAVELMFASHYPKIASIVSNSNGIRSINNRFENFMFFISRVFRKFRINHLLPKKYSNADFEFNLPALRYSKTDSIYPLLDKDEKVNKIISNFVSHQELEKLYNKAFNGDLPSYAKMITIQSIAMSILKMEK